MILVSNFAFKFNVCRYVTASQDEDEVHVWDLAAEDQGRLRKVRLGDAGRPKKGGGWYKSQFTMMGVAIGGGGRLLAASNSNRGDTAVLHMVRGR
jgi:hypothetical protein